MISFSLDPVYVNIGLPAMGVGLLLGRTARRRLGGITGDVLGAAVECGQTAALLLLALSLG